MTYVCRVNVPLVCIYIYAIDIFYGLHNIRMPLIVKGVLLTWLISYHKFDKEDLVFQHVTSENEQFDPCLLFPKSRHNYTERYLQTFTFYG